MVGRFVQKILGVFKKGTGEGALPGEFRFLIEKGEGAAAGEDAARVIKRYERTTAGLSPEGDQKTGRKLNDLALCYALTGNEKKGLALARRIVGEPGDAGVESPKWQGYTPKLLGSLCYNRGLLEFRCGRREAAGWFQRAVLLNRKDDEAFNGLGAAQFAAGEIEEAMRALRTAVKLNPDNIEAQYNLGLTYDRLKKKEDALKQFRWFLERSGERYPEQRREAERRMVRLQA